jgi:hypothetical protein
MNRWFVLCVVVAWLTACGVLGVHARHWIEARPLTTAGTP